MVRIRPERVIYRTNSAVAQQYVDSVSGSRRKSFGSSFDFSTQLNMLHQSAGNENSHINHATSSGSTAGAYYSPSVDGDASVDGERPVVVSVEDKQRLVLRGRIPGRDKDKECSFDRIFTDDAPQEDVYDAVKEDLLEVTKGLNTTLICYGAAKAGKTHTMDGEIPSTLPGLLSEPTAPQRGIVPRALVDVFDRIELMQASNPDLHFYAELSYVEVYNGSIRNLLTGATHHSQASQSLSISVLHFFIN